MRFARTAPALLLFLALLAGCNTTDVMTPQVDVGGGRFPNSAPVTDQDLQQMADTQQPVYPQQQTYNQPVQSQTLQAPQGSLARPGPGAPPTTLEQQAATLGGAATPGMAAPQQPAATASAQTSGDTLRFLPIIGAPLEAVTPLSRQLGAEARANGIVIKGSQDVADHMLKGYFSAVSGGGNITITYVWDVLDGKGARLNRLQGQETFPGDAADPWSAVPASVMQNIATKTIDSYKQWRASQ